MEGKKAHGGDVFGLASEERERILDFSININPLGMSPKGKTAALAQFEREIMRYPDVECREMKAALRQRYRIPEEMILCGNGATELMYVAVRMLRPSAVYAAAPSFSEYRFAAEAVSVPVHTFRLDRNRDFQPEDDSFLDGMPLSAGGRQLSGWNAGAFHDFSRESEQSGRTAPAAGNIS